MEDTIIALLNNNLRVIIPDFGAFIIRQKQPRIIVFNEFLRYNDGILIEFIVKTEGIDYDIAEQRVMDFAEDGSKLLASGRELKIEGLGSLRKDSSGKINFIEAPEISNIENKDAMVPQKIAVVEEQKEILQVIEEVIPQTGKQKIPAKPKSKTAASPKSKTKKAPAKSKPARTTKQLLKTISSDVPLQIAEPVAIEQQEAIESPAIEPADSHCCSTSRT